MPHINFNLYHYVGNNPIRYLDPDGRETYGSDITEEQFFEISNIIRATENGWEPTVNGKTYAEAQQFFEDNPKGVIYRNPDEVGYRFYTNEEKDNPVEYNMITGDELILIGIGKGLSSLGKGIIANVGKNVLKNTLSNKLKHHILSRHTLVGLKSQYGKAPLQKLLGKSIFNPKWSNEKVLSASQKIIQQAIKHGVTNGEYKAKNYGETVTAIMSNGIAQTVYGSYYSN